MERSDTLLRERCNINPPQMIYRFNSIPIKILAGFLVQINKLIPQFMWKAHKKYQNQVGEPILPDINTL